MSDIGMMDAGARAEQARQQQAFEDFYNFRNTLLQPTTTPPTGGQEPEEPEDPIARQMRLDREAAAAAEVVATNRRRQDARSTINAVLSSYGLGELADYTYNQIIVRETVNINNPDAIVFALRDQPAYQKRFAANAARAKKGLPELDPASYIALETQYRETLRSNGLPANFYDSEDDFRALIEGDVSPSELNSRVEQGYRAVADADPEVKRQMQQLYGVSEGELAAYFIDPQRTAPLLTRQARAAQIAARAAEQGGIQLTGTLAEDLARRGITEAEAQRGFAEIGALGELRQAFAGETELTQEQLVGAQFDQDVQAQQELERRRRLRLGEFAGGGQFARTTGATSGSIETGVGTAQ
jgi:hypothetical protein